MKNLKLYFIGFVLILIVFFSIFYYANFINTKTELYENKKYISVAKEMQKRASDMIAAKEKSIIAVGLSLAKDEEITKLIKKKEIPKDYYKKVIEEYKSNTLYQNIWIEVVDKDLNCLYRSWNEKKNDNLRKTRRDLTRVITTKKVAYGVSSGKYTLSLKAMIPIMNNGKLIGILEVIAHFNSIEKQMQKHNIESVVLLSTKMTNELINPSNHLYINGHYIASSNANSSLLKHIKNIGIEHYLDNPYIIDDNYLVSLLPLKCIHDKIVGYYLMFIKVDDISTVKVDFLSFKLLVSGIIFVLFLVGIASLGMLYYMRKQKLYYKAIVDSTTNIVLINNEEQIIDVNHEFFYYFSNYKSLEHFKKEHQCICDFFVNEEGYLSKEIDGIYWVDYLLAKKGRNRIVKLNIQNQIYYFSVNASKIFTRYSTVFTDITEQENFRRELEKLTITDPLTEIGNRRYFQQKIEEELQRSARFSYNISLVMFDIDHFKNVNDEHGHDVGDEVLKSYTKLIRAGLRVGDIFCRVGGEEFIIILPHVNLEHAEVIAEKIRKTVEEHQVKVQVTMSFGVTQVQKGEDIDTMYKRVDTLLYQAKKSGRNKVVSG